MCNKEREQAFPHGEARERLADALVELGSMVRIVDDLSSGRLENLQSHLASGSVEFFCADLREPGVTRMAVQNMEMVFHLAADHGGRGYVDLHQAGPASNLFLDGLVYWEALKAQVEKVVFASSGCVYPNFLQSDPDEEVYLKEDMVRAPYDADNMYGWSKLMSELTLKAYCKEYGIKAVSCRYFTVYGPRGGENHAVMAMIARAFTGQDPVEVCAEKIDDGTAINLGTMERIRVIDAVKMVLAQTGQKAGIILRPEMPTGPLNRVADNSLAKRVLGWEPQTPFREGLDRTIDWYYASKDREETRKIVESKLTER
jgi:nucleoside-diphosphate-sugar epimerase